MAIGFSDMILWWVRCLNEFEVKSGECVGVVGRTGSGKSLLTLPLLRCILTEGNVIYVGVLTSKINLDALRMNITTIPQVPELLSDTLRGNSDPFDQHDDTTLNVALRSAGLFSVQSEDGEGRVTLEILYSHLGHRLRDRHSDPKFALYKPRVGCDAVHDCPQVANHRGC